MNTENTPTHRLHCNRGDYDAPVGGAYGIPEALVAQCARWHEEAHKGHSVIVVPKVKK